MDCPRGANANRLNPLARPDPLDLQARPVNQELPDNPDKQVPTDPPATVLSPARRKTRAARNAPLDLPDLQAQVVLPAAPDLTEIRELQDRVEAKDRPDLLDHQVTPEALGNPEPLDNPARREPTEPVPLRSPDPLAHPVNQALPDLLDRTETPAPPETKDLLDQLDPTETPDNRAATDSQVKADPTDCRAAMPRTVRAPSELSPPCVGLSGLDSSLRIPLFTSLLLAIGLQNSKVH